MVLLTDVKNREKSIIYFSAMANSKGILKSNSA